MKWMRHIGHQEAAYNNLLHSPSLSQPYPYSYYLSMLDHFSYQKLKCTCICMYIWFILWQVQIFSIVEDQTMYCKINALICINFSTAQTLSSCYVHVLHCSTVQVYNSIIMSLDCVRKLTEPKLSSSGTVESSHTRKCSAETGTSYGNIIHHSWPHLVQWYAIAAHENYAYLIVEIWEQKTS